MQTLVGITVLALWLAIASLGIAGNARADDTNAVEDIVNVLQQKGLIDAATGDEILAKQERSEAKKATATPPVSAAAALTEGFVWSGDFRLRNEQFWYGRAYGYEGPNDVNQFRYRARFGFTKQVNSFTQVGLRLASGIGKYNSTNVSFGQVQDFTPSTVYLDRAYAQFALPDPGGIGLTSTLTAGRIANPFIWKEGLDKIVWDEDINPSGFALTSSYSPMEGTTVFGTVGYFVELTQSCCTDTKVFGFQVGGSTTLADKLVAGARASYYDWASVGSDPNFAPDSQKLGNQSIAFNDDVHIGESSVFVKWNGMEGWPALLWGTVAYNFTAQAGTVGTTRPASVGAEDTAWGYGIQFGDPKTFFLLGVEYQYIEANSVLALYTDSDMFDGLTNRKGFGVYLQRELAPNTDFKLSLWDEQPIETAASGGGVGGGPYNISAATDSQANRKRLQADVNFKF